MAGIHGQFGVFTWNATPVPGVQDVSGLGVGDSPIADTTAMGDTAQSAAKGIPGGGTFTVSGRAAAGTTDIGGLATAALASTTQAFLWYPEGTGVGKGKITGTAYVVKYTQSAAFGGAVQWTAEFAITGAVVFGVQ